MAKEKKLNILFDYPQLPYNQSKKGNFIHSYFLAKNLSKKLNLHSINLRNNPKEIKSETKINGEDFFIKKIPIFLNSWIQLIILVLKNVKVDLVYARFSYSLFKQAGFFYSKIFSKPVIFELNGIPWEEEKGFKYNKFFRKFYLFPLKKADLIICVSKEMKKGLLKEIDFKRDNIKIIANGVDTELFKPKNKEKTRKKYSFDRNKKIILFSGAVEKWQGLDTLIEISKNLLSKNLSNFLFLIVGGGNDLDKIKELVKKNNLEKYFKFTGFVSQKKIPEYINLSDFCIAPFVKNRKASPIKIFEYLSCGKCALVSKIPDVCDLRLGKSLIYAKPENVESFTKAIRKALKIKNLDKYKKIGRDSILKKYTWEKVSKQVYKLIKKNKNVSR